MATVEAKLYKHHVKKDGTVNLKIKVYHKEKVTFIDTDHYLSSKQYKDDPKIKTEFVLKDAFIRKQINRTLDDYRLEISKLEKKLAFFSSEQLRNHLAEVDQEIDFIKFCTDFIEGLKDNGKDKSAANFNTIKNSIKDFFRADSVSVNEINVDMLGDWEAFLRTERTMVRLNQFGKEVVTVQKPCKDASIHNYMRDLRGLFNHARKKYNKRHLGITKIEHYPFEEYSIVAAPITRKRNCKVGMINTIRFGRHKIGSRAELARDLFMLSFYMCGVNAADLYQMDKSNIIRGRLEYNRSKTRDKRKDHAFISIKVVKEAKPLLDKYLGKLQLRYGSIGELNKALSIGSREVCASHNLHGITYYWARHSVGTIARNKCRMSIDDIGLALNHVDQGKKTTDIYIEKDWGIVDELQRKVVAKLGRFTRKNIRWKAAIGRVLILNSQSKSA